MSTTVFVATYVDGIFRPAGPIDLPNNTEVELMMKSSDASQSQQPPIGSREAVEAFLRHCRENPLHTDVGWNGRDELYDRI